MEVVLASQGQNLLVASGVAAAEAHLASPPRTAPRTPATGPRTTPVLEPAARQETGTPSVEALAAPFPGSRGRTRYRGRPGYPWSALRKPHLKRCTHLIPRSP